MIWTLILFAHAGIMSDKDSMALTNVTGFTSQQECVAAGDQAKRMASGTTKVIKFTCVQVTK
jgi:hypothetical protein